MFCSAWPKGEMERLFRYSRSSLPLSHAGKNTKDLWALLVLVPFVNFFYTATSMHFIRSCCPFVCGGSGSGGVDVPAVLHLYLLGGIYIRSNYFHHKYLIERKNSVQAFAVSFLSRTACSRNGTAYESACSPTDWWVSFCLPSPCTLP